MIKLSEKDFINYCFKCWCGDIKQNLLYRQDTNGECVVLSLFYMYINQLNYYLCDGIRNKVLILFVYLFEYLILKIIRFIRVRSKKKTRIYSNIKKIELKFEMMLINFIVWYVNLTKLCKKL